MAVTSYGVNDALAVKLWSKRLDVEALKETFYSDYIGTTGSALAQEQTDLKKGAGDSITWALRSLLAGEGVTENETLEGNEETLSTYSDSLLINELNHAVRVRNTGTIDAQRVPYDLREEAYSALKDWVVDRLDTAFMNQLAGNTAQTNTKYTGFNATLAPSSNRMFRGGTAVATDQALGTGDVFILNLINKCVNRAKTSSPMIRPIKGLGRDIDYVMFIHPDQTLSLRNDTATAGNWFDLQGKRLQGGEGDKNALFTGALGVYNRTLIVESNRMPLGVHSTTGASVANTRRAVFCGAQALAVAFGMDASATKFQWKEELFDYGRELGVAAKLIYGMKKGRYNSEDYGSIVVTTYAATVS